MPGHATVSPRALALALIAASCGGPPPEAEVQTADLEARIGAVFHRDGVVCLLLRNGTVAPGEPVWILSDEVGTFTHGVGRVIGEREGCAGHTEGPGLEIFFHEFDRVTRAAGLKPLRHTALPEGEREVRVWIGGGLGYPQELFRIIHGPGGASGELVLYWRADRGDREREGETFHDLMLYTQAGRCDGFRVGAGMGVCRALFTVEPVWAEILRAAEAAGLWTLPDQSTVPGDRPMAVDGWGVSVELRDGASYRAYHYGNPERSDSPEARRAVRIADVLTALRASIRSADVAREYRGATSGAYRSGFRACGNDEEWEFRGDLTWLAERAGLALPPAPGDSAAYYVSLVGSLAAEWLGRRWGSAYDRVLEPWEVLEVREWTGTECQGASEPRGLDPAGAV